MEKGEVDTHLYTIDFTREPADSHFLKIRDTVTTGSQCLSWASLKSVELKNGSLHVVVDYGRDRLSSAGKIQDEFKNRAMQSRGSPSGFPHQLYDIEFRFGPAGLSLVEASKSDFEYVTAKWEVDQGQTCSASR